MLNVYSCVYLQFNVFGGKVTVVFKKDTKNKLLTYLDEVDGIL